MISDEEFDVVQSVFLIVWLLLIISVRRYFEYLHRILLFAYVNLLISYED